MTPPVLLLRVDANSEIGMGHAMRCRALGQAWQESGGTAIFLQQSMPQDLLEQLRHDGVMVENEPHPPASEEDAAFTAHRAKTLGANWIVADSYAFGSRYLAQLRGGRSRALAFDDEGNAPQGAADLVLRPWRMTSETQPGFLDGPQYALIRQEFTGQIANRREIPACASRFLITFGGADVENWTGKLLDALAGADSPILEDSELLVLIGAVNAHTESLKTKLSALPGTVQLERATREMAQRLAWADVGIGASGSTCWEMCAVGLPALLLPLNGNQLPIAQGLAAAGAAQNLGAAGNLDAASFRNAVRALAADQPTRANMAAAGRRLVDGRGAARVVAKLREMDAARVGVMN